MGIFGFGKKKKDKGNEEVKEKKSKKSKEKKGKDKKDREQVSEEIKAPVIFEDDEKFEKILSNILFSEEEEGVFSDFGVKVGESLGPISSIKTVVDNRVRLFLSLDNYKTGDLIFKGSDGSNGITGQEYKVQCAEFSKMLNCRFISDKDKEIEIGRLYCLELYGQDMIEFWRVVQVYALLSGKTDELNLKYCSMFDRLEQAFTAIDISKVSIKDCLVRVIIATYNMKLKDEQRVKKQLQMFIEEISKDYNIPADTWVVIYKYLNGLIATGFKQKLDEKRIQIGYGFKLEAANLASFEKEEVSGYADTSEVFRKKEESVENVLSSQVKEFEEEETMQDNLQVGNDSFVETDFGEPVEEIVNEPVNRLGNSLDVSDEDEVSKDFSETLSYGSEVVGFDDYQRNLSRDDNTGNFDFKPIDGESLIGKAPYICLKMSNMMKSYFNKDSFNSVIRQIFNLNTALNIQYGIDNCIVQLCNKTYNPMELTSDMLDDFMETITRSDIELEDYRFTNVLDVMEELIGDQEGAILFVLYDRIIDRTPSVAKMRKMSKFFEKNKVVFIQLDTECPDNFDKFRNQEVSLFTNCRFILATEELVCNSIHLGTELRDSFLN